MPNLVPQVVTARNEKSALASIQRTLLADYRELGTWEEVGKKWGCNRGLVYRIAKQGYEPVNLELRRKFGFPPKAIEVNVYVLMVLIAYFHLPDKPKPRIYHRLDTMPVWMLRWMIENREEMG